MNKKKGDATIAVIIIIVVALIIIASYFMFFRNGTNNETENMNNNSSNNGTNNNVNIYDNDNLSSDMKESLTLSDANARDFYERVKKGITLNGKLVEVPAKYMARLTDKIGAEGYKLTNDAKKTVNSKFDEIEKTLSNNKVSDINDLDNKTKDKIEELINDIEKAL